MALPQKPSLEATDAPQRAPLDPHQPLDLQQLVADKMLSRGAAASIPLLLLDRNGKKVYPFKESVTLATLAAFTEIEYLAGGTLKRRHLNEIGKLITSAGLHFGMDEGAIPYRPASEKQLIGKGLGSPPDKGWERS